MCSKDKSSNSGVFSHPAFWALLILVGFSLFLAYSRIYQVDEAQNIFSARILASGWEHKYYTAAEPWILWPLSWFASWTSSATTLLHLSRSFMICVFWANVSLIALNCGVQWNSKTFLWILLGAATLAPMWDYGFEVRHDNTCLFLLLACLFAMRWQRSRTLLSALVVGSCCALLPLTAYKSLVYLLPLLLFYVLFPPPARGRSRARVALFVTLGFLGTCLGVFGALLLTGHLSAVMQSLRFAAKITTSSTVHFTSWGTFARMIYPCPLLSATALSALVGTLLTLREGWRNDMGWSGNVPEAILFLTAMGALIINPTPFPYNLCLLVPFAFILAVRWLVPLVASTHLGRPVQILAAGILFFTHLMPFVKSTLRHLDWPNDRQLQVVELAEQMTDPKTDRVYDGAGLVNSRESIGNQWFLHSSLMEAVNNGQLPSVHQMLTEHPAAVLIPNYRFSWLSPLDVKFIQGHYVALAGDFFVLGQVIEGPEGIYSCIHPGRYALRSDKPGQGLAAESFKADGTLVRLPTILPFTKGEHHITAPGPSKIMISWVGPNLEQEPLLPPGSAESFFVNWY